MDTIRNFAIIAHIDHGKSTLADRLLEITNVVRSGDHKEQMLDRNPISRERGITIKLAPVRMQYYYIDPRSQMSDGRNNPSDISHLKSEIRDQTSGIIELLTYTLNLIDTPGHVDFSYEVDRTLACVEGVILLVDATQGIQAQTIANAYKAIEKNLVIIPAINKIDLPNADVEKSRDQLVDFLGINKEEIFEISAKTGKNVKELLHAVVEKIPPPVQRLTSETRNSDGSRHSLILPLVLPGQSRDARHRDPSIRDTHKSQSNNTSHIRHQTSDIHIQALIFDSYYDSHRGVIAFVRNFQGSLKKGIKVKLAANKVTFEVNEVGIFKPDLEETSDLSVGQIGYVVTNLKDIHQVRVGDTIIDEKNTTPPLAGYKKINPIVYASMFTTDTNDYLNLSKALEKLYLNDSSLEFSPIYSKALGAGFRVGFLGLLHADVVHERLEREYGLDLVLTPPRVEYKYENGQFYEPIVKILIITPDNYVGNVLQLCEKYRVRFITMDNKNQTSLYYEMPMPEMVSDFFDNLKSVSSGYASLDWEFLRYDLVKADKLELLLNGDPVEEFSEVVVSERAEEKGRELTAKLREIIPRQQYEIKIQARYKGKIIASERIAPFRKDVLVKNSKVVGAGDFGRKRKLLEKQKEGKKKMKMIGKVEIPKESFLKLFRKS